MRIADYLRLSAAFLLLLAAALSALDVLPIVGLLGVYLVLLVLLEYLRDPDTDKGTLHAPSRGVQEIAEARRKHYDDILTTVCNKAFQNARIAIRRQVHDDADRRLCEKELQETRNRALGKVLEGALSRSRNRDVLDFFAETPQGDDEGATLWNAPAESGQSGYVETSRRLFRESAMHLLSQMADKSQVRRRRRLRLILAAASRLRGFAIGTFCLCMFLLGMAAIYVIFLPLFFTLWDLIVRPLITPLGTLVLRVWTGVTTFGTYTGPIFLWFWGTSVALTIFRDFSDRAVTNGSRCAVFARSLSTATGCVLLGLFIVLCMQIALGTFAATASSSLVLAGEEWVAWAYSTLSARLRLGETLLILAALATTSVFIPGAQLVSRFREMLNFLGRLMTVLLTLSSFTFFSSAVGDDLQERWVAELAPRILQKSVAIEHLQRHLVAITVVRLQLRLMDEDWHADLTEFLRWSDGSGFRSNVVLDSAGRMARNVSSPKPFPQAERRTEFAGITEPGSVEALHALREGSRPLPSLGRLRTLDRQLDLALYRLGQVQEAATESLARAAAGYLYEVSRPLVGEFVARIASDMAKETFGAALPHVVKDAASARQWIETRYSTAAGDALKQSVPRLWTAENRDLISPDGRSALEAEFAAKGNLHQDRMTSLPPRPSYVEPTFLARNYRQISGWLQALPRRFQERILETHRRVVKWRRNALPVSGGRGGRGGRRGR